MRNPVQQAGATAARGRDVQRPSIARDETVPTTPEKALAKDVRRKAQQTMTELARRDYPGLERIAVSIRRTWVGRTQLQHVAGWRVATYLAAPHGQDTSVSTIWLLCDGQLAVQTGGPGDPIRRTDVRDEALQPHLPLVSAGLDELIQRSAG